MAALKKNMGIGSTDVKGTKLPHTAAATDATSVQLCMALIIHVSNFSILFATVCACAPHARLECSPVEVQAVVNRQVANDCKLTMSLVV